jgi:cell fate (sporulation/competence/biofilm development) regulator YmcA (YheA/YmcA/DUF963 family)
MKTFQEFQEQMLSSAERHQVQVAALKSAARQRVNYANWQRKHAYHEIEMKNSREDRDRLRRQRETQPA